MSEIIRIHGAILHITGSQIENHPIGEHIRGNLLVFARYEHQTAQHDPFLLIAFSDSIHKDAKLRDRKTGAPLDAYALNTRHLMQQYRLWLRTHTEQVTPAVEDVELPKTYAQEDATNELYD
jgi:hypothetical protein